MASLVMFAVGSGSVAWMLVLGVVMAGEESPVGVALSAPASVVLVTAALAAAIVHL